MIYFILAFIGLLFGVLLASVAKEELKAGRKYFIIFYKSLIFVLIILFLYLAEINIWLVGIVFGVIFGLYFKNLYFYLGLGMFASLNIYVAFLVFFIGLPYGTLIYDKKRNLYMILASLVLFFVCSLLLLVNGNIPKDL